MEIAFAGDDGKAQIFIAPVLHQDRRSIGFLLPRGSSPVKEDLKVTVHFIREESLGSFQSQVVMIDREDRFPHFTVTAPSLIHWQRIDPGHLPLRELPFAELSFPGEILFESEKLDCITSEIGGSDLALLTPKALEEESEVSVVIHPPGREVSFEARVISSTRYRGKLPKGSHLKFETILNFIDISMEDQDYLLHLVMERSLENDIPAAPPAATQPPA